MSLIDGLNEAAQTLKTFAALLDAVAAQPIQITVAATTGADDKAEADAIKRGQRPESLAALKQALNG